MIAALFVETGGCYFGLPNVDPWDKDRDATYDAAIDACIADARSAIAATQSDTGREG